MNTSRWSMGASLVLATGLLVGACGSSDTDAVDLVDTTDAVDPVETTDSVDPVETADSVDPAVRALLIDFATAWDSADWEAAGSLATSEAVEVAMEWHSEHANAAEDVTYALDNGCLDAFETGMTCEFVYTAPDSRGLIFDATFAAADSGLMVTDLVFGGEAG